MSEDLEDVSVTITRVWMCMYMRMHMCTCMWVRMYLLGSLLHTQPSGKGTRAQSMALGGDRGTGEGAAKVWDLEKPLLLLLLLLLRGDNSSGMGD